MPEKPVYENATLHIDKKDGAVRIRIHKRIKEAPNFNFQNTDKLRVEYFPSENKIVIRRLSDLD